MVTYTAFSSAFPAGDQSYLKVQVQLPGGTGSYGTSVSKTKVNLESNGKITEDRAYPHVPPFLAFRKVNADFAKPPASPQYFPTPAKPAIKATDLAT